MLAAVGESISGAGRCADSKLGSIRTKIWQITRCDGGSLFPSVLLYLQEPYEDRPMLDKLHRLEKLGYLEESEQWQSLRMLRNRFAHEYPDAPDKNAALLMLAIESVPSLVDMLERIGQKLSLTFER